MDIKDLAAALREQLTPEKWWDGRGVYAPGEKMCLGMALQKILMLDNDLASYMDYELNTILPVINRLFPYRTCRSIPMFNDQSSYEDVMLVIKHLEGE